MERIENGFWDYVERWRGVFKDAPGRVAWDGRWLANSSCAACRFCCGRQDSSYPFPMPLLPGQGRPGLERDFNLLDSLTPYLGAQGCKSCSEQGCMREQDEKPIACRLFPIVLINGGLYLYQNCPAVIFSPLIEFMDLGRKAAGFLNGLSLEELRRLSMWLDADALSRSYIDLRIKLFEGGVKKLVFG